jgi:hypothetical protein
MDRRDVQQVEQQRQAFESAEEGQKGEMEWLDEDGKKFRMPYRMIKEVTFSDLDTKELKDIPYCARLQYRLMLMDSVLKAKVAFHKRFITIIYNPVGATNIKEKISMEQLVQFLANEGVHVKPEKTAERDYDYYREFYQYAYFPPVIREAPPYGWTREEWKAEKVRKEREAHRLEHQTVAGKIKAKIFGSKAKKNGAGISLH